MPMMLRTEVATTSTEDGMVLLDERTGRYFQLNSTGAFVVKVLAAGSTPQEAARALCDHYEVSASQAESDIAALITALRAANLVTP